MKKQSLAVLLATCSAVASVAVSASADTVCDRTQKSTFPAPPNGGDQILHNRVPGCRAKYTAFYRSGQALITAQLIQGVRAGAVAFRPNGVLSCAVSGTIPNAIEVSKACLGVPVRWEAATTN